MKKLHIYSLITLILLSLAGCTQKEETAIPNPTFETSFTATMEVGDGTKALLGETEEGGYRSLLWEPGDSIEILCRSLDYVSSYTGHKFVNIETQDSHQAVFEGSMCRSYDVLAIYPHDIYSYSPIWSEGTDGNPGYYKSVVSIPSTQQYRENNISKKAVPMAAYMALKMENDYKISGNLEFRNLYGVLVLNLKGEDKVRTITMTATDSLGKVASLSGFGEIDRTADGYHIIKMRNATADGMAEPGTSYITLECPDVQLNTVVPTPFHIALPPGKYSSFNLLITTSEGKVMLVESNKELVINRSKIRHTTPLVYTETVAIDLSERGTSNSYIVSNAGVYKFNASVIGNGAEGIKPNANFHTSDPSISPASVELLWEDKSGLISSLTLDSENGYATFMTSDQEGNALIAAKDEEGSILWSWHIWCTDKPVEHTYINHHKQSFIVMDRNLGATRADRGVGEEWRDAAGLVYQWGRKDPFAYGKDLKASFKFSIEQSIQYPQYISHNYMWLVDGNTCAKLWGETKTIYDPCPVGYKVAPKETWTGFTTTGEATTNPNEPNWTLPWDKGVYFTYDGTNKAWYPASYCGWFNVYMSESESECWTSTINSYDTDWGSAFRLYVRYGGDMDVNVQPQSALDLGGARPVRCVADEGYIDPTLPVVDIVTVSSITEYDALAQSSIVTSGSSEVTSKGVVWSKNPNPTIDLSTKTEDNGSSSNFTTAVTGLESFTTYYIRAYATNSYGTAYGPELEFSTTYSGDATDLSATESANSYIVNDVYSVYKFRAVKGNSSEELSDPFSGSVVWVSYGTTESIKSGDLIDNVLYHDGYIYFKLDEVGKEGNALIAVKDTKGEILWSWHIWYTDFDPEATAQTYPSGAVLMDRNLGALNNSTDVPSYGLLYQWGRKDPFVGSGDGTNTFASTYPADAISFVNTSDNRNSLSYATAHPNHNIMGSTWNFTNTGTTWWGAEKTIYDPCPPGWQIPPLSAWDNYSHGTFTYPLTGGLSEGSSYLSNVNINSIVWSYTIQDFEWIRTFRTHSGHWETESGSAADVSCGRSVRCQKIQ